MTAGLLDADSATTICTTSTYFTFEDPEQTSIALTNMYMYMGNYNGKYFEDWTGKLALDPVPTAAYFYGETNPWTVFF